MLKCSYPNAVESQSGFSIHIWHQHVMWGVVMLRKMYLLFYNHSFSSDCVWEKCFLGLCASCDERGSCNTLCGHYAKSASQPSSAPGGLDLD